MTSSLLQKDTEQRQQRRQEIQYRREQRQYRREQRAMKKQQNETPPLSCYIIAIIIHLIIAYFIITTNNLLCATVCYILFLFSLKLICIITDSFIFFQICNLLNEYF